MPQQHFSDEQMPGDLPPLRIVFGSTPEMLAIRKKLESVARTGIPLLIQGESGTGKEVCVRLVHAFQGKMGGALVKVSCPAIPQSLLETELFGYEKGAFTGANTTKRGRVEQADGGTLFLDEVGSLDLAVQSKLLQLLQDGTFMRVGGHETRTIQTRLITVANGNLQEQVRDGSFRLDFLYRINAMTIDIPPLRRRLEDIPEIVEYFFEQHTRAFGTSPAPLSRSALRWMQQYNWPGNIRQLDNLVRTYVLLGDEERLIAELANDGADEIDPIASLDVSEPISLKQVTKRATHNLERQIIMRVLRANSWNRQKTAKWLKISYRSLLYKLNGQTSFGDGDTMPPMSVKTTKPSTRTAGIPSAGPRLL
jgi:two-component system response regulator AtoC